MLKDIFSFYIQGLISAVIFTVLALIFWLVYRALKQKDKTVKARQNALYDGIMMVMVSIPILSFAFLAIIIMVKSS